MTLEEMDKLFPEFEKYMKSHYQGVLVHPSVLKCWYQFCVENHIETKVCSYCHKEKSVIEFGNNRSRVDGLTHYCKSCITLIHPKYKEKRKDYYKDQSKTYSKGWRATPHGYYMMLVNNAKARSRDVTFSETEFEDWLLQQGNKCYYCGNSLERFKGGNGSNKHRLTIDRKDNDITYTLDNIVLSCASCNLIKRDVFTAEEMKEIAIKYITPKH